MDAFRGFVRGTRRKSEELGVVSVEMGGFYQPIFNHLLGENFYWPAPLAEPPRSTSDSSKRAGLHSRQVRFLIGAKATARGSGALIQKFTANDQKKSG